MSDQFIVIVYDISSDRRRTKLHNVLLDYGTPVQYSVFECLVDKETLMRLKKAVGRVIRPKVDHVRYYYLCQTCLKKVEITSGKEVLEEQEAIVV